MSEHFSIEGKPSYWHLAWAEDGSPSYCTHCKKTCSKMRVDIDEGFGTLSATIRCGKCGKAIFRIVGDFWEEKNPNLIFAKDDRKCSVCKKKLNYMDCYCQGTFFYKRKWHDFIVCSKKCEKEWDKRSEHDANRKRTC